MTIEIPLKLPSFNQYIDACRVNRFAGAKMKKDTQTKIEWFLIGRPKITKPVFIEFHWVEENKRRDIDNVSYGKKFILDALQEMGILPNDNQRYVKGFQDTFEIGEKAKVIVTIKEIEQ